MPKKPPKSRPTPALKVPVEVCGEHAITLASTQPQQPIEPPTRRVVGEVVLRVDKAQPRPAREAQHLHVVSMYNPGGGRQPYQPRTPAVAANRSCHTTGHRQGRGHQIQATDGAPAASRRGPAPGTTEEATHRATQQPARQGPASRMEGRQARRPTEGHHGKPEDKRGAHMGAHTHVSQTWPTYISCTIMKAQPQRQGGWEAERRQPPALQRRR